ncbi:glycosyltransferase family 2 protein [Cyclobacterium salsum]|uniref:glycosyltransferase family 2 protein n=1 Tax=Cyclobacterium salsum TaxID=2666329 RepID=UPI0013908B3B|nr:glycosyltransferase family 2 protein [Cyclobacterium salsum]
MHNPLVSILIPNYNKSPYLRETLDSVLQQTYTNWECILVDDHSTDDSWKILEEYANLDTRFKIFKRPENRQNGGNAARNFGFELSQGEFINWLDSDDVINIEFITEKISTFEIHPNLDYVLSNIYKFQLSINEKIPIYDSNDDKKFFVNFGGTNRIFQTPMALYKKSFLNTFDYLFDEEIIAVQDMEFHVRVMLKSLNYRVNLKSIVFWRINEGSKTTSFINNSYCEKYKKSYPAFKKIFLSIQDKNIIDKKAELFFQNVFNDMLLNLPFCSSIYWDIFFFAAKHRLFKGKYQALRIFGIRILKSVKLI